ncbi:hypothetical protein D3C71_1267700 [compost metagenome]
MLHHLHPALAQAVLLPLLGIGRHVHRALEAQGRCHHANAHPQVAGGAHRHLVAAQHLAGGRGGQRTVITAGLYQPMLQRQPLGKLQHLVHAAPGLDRARHRQAVIGLDEQAPLPLGQTERRLQRDGGQQRRLHYAPGGSQLREHLRQQARKTGQPVGGGLRIIQTNAAPQRLQSSRGLRLPGRVSPQRGLGIAQAGGQQRIHSRRSFSRRHTDSFSR